eukprot:jgi/Tetstr1/449257/TSEL_036462.t1
MDELKDLVPDAELSLPAFNVVTGSCDPRSFKSTLLEFKTMRAVAAPPAYSERRTSPTSSDRYTRRMAKRGDLANLELPTVEQLAEAIAATISQRINTPPELMHAHWLTDTMMAAGVDMQQYHTEPKLLRVGDDNLCIISIDKDDDEEFADTLRPVVALTSPVALLRAVRLRTIVIHFTDSEFHPLELVIPPFNQTVREAGELGGNTGHNQLGRTTLGMRKNAGKTPPASHALRAEERPVCTLTLQLTAHHHSIIGTRATDTTE